MLFRHVRGIAMEETTANFMYVIPYLVTGIFSVAAAFVASPRNNSRWIDDVRKKIEVLDGLSDLNNDPTTRAAKIALERDIAATILEHNGMTVSDGKITYKREGMLRYQILGSAISFIPNLLLAYKISPMNGIISAAKSAATSSIVVAILFMAGNALLKKFPKTARNRTYAVGAAKRVDADDITRRPFD